MDNRTTMDHMDKRRQDTEHVGKFYNKIPILWIIVCGSIGLDSLVQYLLFSSVAVVVECPLGDMSLSLPVCPVLLVNRLLIF